MDTGKAEASRNECNTWITDAWPRLPTRNLSSYQPWSKSAFSLCFLPFAMVPFLSRFLRARQCHEIEREKHSAKSGGRSYDDISAPFKFPRESSFVSSLHECHTFSLSTCLLCHPSENPMQHERLQGLWILISSAISHRSIDSFSISFHGRTTTCFVCEGMWFQSTGSSLCLATERHLDLFVGACW